MTFFNEALKVLFKADRITVSPLRCELLSLPPSVTHYSVFLWAQKKLRADFPSKWILSLLHCLCLEVAFKWKCVKCWFWSWRIQRPYCRGLSFFFLSLFFYWLKIKPLLSARLMHLHLMNYLRNFSTFARIVSTCLIAASLLGFFCRRMKRYHSYLSCLIKAGNRQNTWSDFCEEWRPV